MILKRSLSYVLILTIAFLDFPTIAFANQFVGPLQQNQQQETSAQNSNVMSGAEQGNGPLGGTANFFLSGASAISSSSNNSSTTQRSYEDVVRDYYGDALPEGAKIKEEEREITFRLYSVEFDTPTAEGVHLREFKIRTTAKRPIAEIRDFNADGDLLHLFQKGSNHVNLTVYDSDGTETRATCASPCLTDDRDIAHAEMESFFQVQSRIRDFQNGIAENRSIIVNKNDPGENAAHAYMEFGSRRGGHITRTWNFDTSSGSPELIGVEDSLYENRRRKIFNYDLEGNEIVIRFGGKEIFRERKSSLEQLDDNVIADYEALLSPLTQTFYDNNTFHIADNNEVIRTTQNGDGSWTIVFRGNDVFLDDRGNKLDRIIKQTFTISQTPNGYALTNYLAEEDNGRDIAGMTLEGDHLVLKKADRFGRLKEEIRFINGEDHYQMTFGLIVNALRFDQFHRSIDGVKDFFSNQSGSSSARFDLRNVKFALGKTDDWNEARVDVLYENPIKNGVVKQTFIADAFGKFINGRIQPIRIFAIDDFNAQDDLVQTVIINHSGRREATYLRPDDTGELKHVFKTRLPFKESYHSINIGEQIVNYYGEEEFSSHRVAAIQYESRNHFRIGFPDRSGTFTMMFDLDITNSGANIRQIQYGFRDASILSEKGPYRRIFQIDGDDLVIKHPNLLVRARGTQRFEHFEVIRAPLGGSLTEETILNHPIEKAFNQLRFSPLIAPGPHISGVVTDQFIELTSTLDDGTPDKLFRFDLNGILIETVELSQKRFLEIAEDKVRDFFGGTLPEGVEVEAFVNNATSSVDRVEVRFNGIEFLPGVDNLTFSIAWNEDTPIITEIIDAANEIKITIENDKTSIAIKDESLLEIISADEPTPTITLTPALQLLSVYNFYEGAIPVGTQINRNDDGSISLDMLDGQGEFDITRRVFQFDDTSPYLSNTIVDFSGNRNLLDPAQIFYHHERTLRFNEHQLNIDYRETSGDMVPVYSVNRIPARTAAGLSEIFAMTDQVDRYYGKNLITDSRSSIQLTNDPILGWRAISSLAENRFLQYKSKNHILEFSRDENRRLWKALSFTADFRLLGKVKFKDDGTLVVKVVVDGLGLVKFFDGPLSREPRQPYQPRVNLIDEASAITTFFEGTPPESVAITSDGFGFSMSISEGDYAGTIGYDLDENFNLNLFSLVIIKEDAPFGQTRRTFTLDGNKVTISEGDFDFAQISVGEREIDGPLTYTLIQKWNEELDNPVVNPTIEVLHEEIFNDQVSIRIEKRILGEDENLFLIINTADGAQEVEVQRWRLYYSRSSRYVNRSRFEAIGIDGSRHYFNIRTYHHQRYQRYNRISYSVQRNIQSPQFGEVRHNISYRLYGSRLLIASENYAQAYTRSWRNRTYTSYRSLQHVYYRRNNNGDIIYKQTTLYNPTTRRRITFKETPQSDGSIRYEELGSYYRVGWRWQRRTTVINNPVIEREQETGIILRFHNFSLT